LEILQPQEKQEDAQGARRVNNIMGRQFDEDDDEYVELIKEYERYIRDTPGAYEDFDEWLELEYYGTKKAKKIHKKPTKRRKGIED